jgi:Predicted thioesterase
MDFVVEGRLLTDVGGTIGASVLSTPGMIGMIEGNAAALAFENLDEGKATVGFEVCVKHVAAAAEGQTLHRPREADRHRRRTQALLRRRGQGGRADDRRRHPPAPRHPGAGPGGLKWRDIRPV